MADAEQERHLSALLLNARHAAKTPEVDATGLCRNCDAPLEPLARFCDQECMLDFTKRQSASRALRNRSAEDEV